MKFENLGTIKLDTKNIVSQMYPTFGKYKYLAVEREHDQPLNCFKAYEEAEFFQVHYNGDSSKEFDIYTICSSEKWITLPFFV